MRSKRGTWFYGPEVPGGWARFTPLGRRRMRELLTSHLEAASAEGVPERMLVAIRAELRRYGG